MANKVNFILKYLFLLYYDLQEPSNIDQKGKHPFTFEIEKNSNPFLGSLIIDSNLLNLICILNGNYFISDTKSSNVIDNNKEVGLVLFFIFYLLFYLLLG